MDRCIFCHAPSLFSICEDCEASDTTSILFTPNISDAAAPRPKRTNRWYAPASFFSGATIIDSDVTW